MNSIQLELFPQELIRVGMNSHTSMVDFDSEGRRGWIFIWELAPFICIIREGGGDRPGDLFPGYNYQNFPSQDSFSQNFMCVAGTWDQICLVSEFSHNI